MFVADAFDRHIDADIPFGLLFDERNDIRASRVIRLNPTHPIFR